MATITTVIELQDRMSGPIRTISSALEGLGRVCNRVNDSTIQPLDVAMVSDAGKKIQQLTGGYTAISLAALQAAGSQMVFSSTMHIGQEAAQAYAQSVVQAGIAASTAAQSMRMETAASITNALATVDTSTYGYNAAVNFTAGFTGGIAGISAPILTIFTTVYNTADQAVMRFAQGFGQAANSIQARTATLTSFFTTAWNAASMAATGSVLGLSGSVSGRCTQMSASFFSVGNSISAAFSRGAASAIASVNRISAAVRSIPAVNVNGLKPAGVEAPSFSAGQGQLQRAGYATNGQDIALSNAPAGATQYKELPEAFLASLMLKPRHKTPEGYQTQAEILPYSAKERPQFEEKLRQTITTNEYYASSGGQQITAGNEHGRTELTRAALMQGYEKLDVGTQHSDEGLAVSKVMARLWESVLHMPKPTEIVKAFEIGVPKQSAWPQNFKRDFSKQWEEPRFDKMDLPARYSWQKNKEIPLPKEATGLRGEKALEFVPHNVAANENFTVKDIPQNVPANENFTVKDGTVNKIRQMFYVQKPQEQARKNAPVDQLQIAYHVMPKTQYYKPQIPLNATPRRNESSQMGKETMVFQEHGVEQEFTVADRDLQFLRELARKEAVNRFTTAEIKVEMNNNNHFQSSDAEGIIHKLKRGLEEVLYTVAEGV